MFGNSFIVGMILKFVAQKGLDFIKDFSADKKDEVEAWVKDLVKPDALDNVVWGAVEKVWDTLLAAASVLAGRLIEGVNQDKALAEAVASVKPAYMAALEGEKVEA